MKPRHKLEKKHTPKENPERIRIWLIPILVLVLIKIVYGLSFMYTGPQPEMNTLINKILSSDVSAKEDSPQKSEAKNSDAGKAETASPEDQKTSDNATKRSDKAENGAWSYELVSGLKQRETDLQLKEDSMRKEEERLKELKLALEKKIETLAQLEKKIADLVATKKTIEDEKLLKLAKVFEETPAEQAGPLLSKLDIDIAAQLLMKMTGRKAGKIWGFVEPARAVEISKVIAKINPNIDLNKIAEKP